MPADSSRSNSFDPIVLNQLACPACLGALRQDADRLICTECARTYPIVDGIPVLIAERAETKDSSN
jgi:uncharacterized protein YbaR (Trm112 family)